MPMPSLPKPKDLDAVLIDLGSAVMVCQGLEATLVFLLAIFEMEDADAADGSFKAAIEALSEKTLGQLLKRLRTRLSFSENAEVQFRSGWEARNWVVHGFLRSTTEDFMSSQGRKRVRSRIAEAKRTVQQTERLAHHILEQYLEAYGIPLEELRKQTDLLLASSNATEN
jgi:hypothetical protein